MPSLVYNDTSDSFTMGSVDQTPQQGEMSEQPTPGRATLFWLRDLTLSVVIAIIVILFLYQPVKVEGTSMLPSIQNEERIFINKFVYRFGLEQIQRGDTVVFWFPNDTSKSYIKRVIGLPGDTVEVREGTVVVNGQPLDEPYVPLDFRDRVSVARQKLGADRYFVLGDHRNSSNDSRTGWTVPRSYIYGKAVFVYWPLERLGLLH